MDNTNIDNLTNTLTDNRYNIGVISLGCDKNRVDTEKMLFRVKMYGHRIVNELNDADVIIVNTCAFLQSSRKESIDAILEAAYVDGIKARKVIVTGCLPQKFIDDIYNGLTEADAFLGTNDYSLINHAIDCVIRGERFNGVNSVACSNLAENNLNSDKEGVGRVITTRQHYAYLMVSDGCDNKCSYCLIPKIRGKFRSFSLESILKEAEDLIASGAQELILVAQDLTRYGKDLNNGENLVTLIRKLSDLSGLKDNSIRLMYCYPEQIKDDLIDEIATNPKVIKYIDMPLQHVSDNVLKNMYRASRYDGIISLIKKLREKVQGISIRSTFIVGFPGETAEDFEVLKDFILTQKLDNVGFFAYSRERETASYSFPNQVRSDVKKRRLKAINLASLSVYKELNSQYLGKIINVVCDGFDAEKQLYFGRDYKNAPLCDKLVYFSGEAVTGNDYNVIINLAADYDLFGKII